MCPSSFALAIHPAAKTKADSARLNKQNFLRPAASRAHLESAHLMRMVFFYFFVAHICTYRQGPRWYKINFPAADENLARISHSKHSAQLQNKKAFTFMYSSVFLLIELSRLAQRQLSNSPCAREKWISSERTSGVCKFIAGGKIWRRRKNWEWRSFSACLMLGISSRSSISMSNATVFSNGTIEDDFCFLVRKKIYNTALT